jgi:hypothetical protein
VSGGSFAKRDREKARRERTAMKQEKRAQRRENDALEPAPTVTTPEEDVLAALAALHEAHGAGRMKFDDFEAAKAELLAQLQV